MKKLLQFIKDEYKFLIFLILLFTFMTIRLPYSIYAPGGRIDLSDRYENEIYETNGSLNITYVSSYPGTIPLLLISKLIPNWDIIKNDDTKYDNETMEDLKKRELIQNESANSNSIYVAYKKAGIEPNITNKKMYVTYIYQDAKTDLKIGDIILKADNKEFEDHLKLAEYIKSKEINDKITFEVLRNNKTINCYGILSNIQDTKVIGIAFSVTYEYENTPNISYKTKRNELGASGGLMMALYVYNSLIEEDITKGKDIAGTGTIDLDGTVGEIDGVKYKITGAYKKGIRIFIVPKENEDEARKVIEDNKYDINLIVASTFDEAITKLKGIE